MTSPIFQFDSRGALIGTSLPFPKRTGKVRDVYDLGDRLMIVSTDRISAFDWILPDGIPEKGRLLTKISLFWFEHLSVPHHLLETQVGSIGLPASIDWQPLEDRTMLVRKADVIPFECVVRGYLEGSGLQEYQQSQKICGISLPGGLRQGDKLPQPLFTPATKAEQGHDENVTYASMVQTIGQKLASDLQSRSLAIYDQATRWAIEKGIIIADTKFEFGHVGDELILVDEVLTPDSSRFWDAQTYQPGQAQKSYDKQFVREWLTETSWDRDSPPPQLPKEIIEKTQQKYTEAFQRLVVTET